jgi:hypothetical protein
VVATDKRICRKKTGPRGYDSCYQEVGHSGKCFTSFGRKMEHIVQEVLRFAGRKVVTATLDEDEKDGVDCWIECSREECFLVLEKKGFVPIQFTVNRDASYGDKGCNAMDRGVVIVWISDTDLRKWEEVTNKDARKALALEITNRFLRAVDSSTTIISYLNVGLQQPPKDSRFRDKLTV